MMNPRYYLLLAVLAGSSCQDDSDKTPEPAKTTADFTYSGTLQNFTPVQFTNQATEAQSYSWSFGDGQTSTDPNPAHIFRRAGSYQVRLQATGPNGSADVTKTLTLAQADTAAIVLDKTAGRYRFGKVIQSDYMLGTGSQPSTYTVTRLRDTTLTITNQGPELRFPWRTSYIPVTFRSSSERVPVGSRYPSYYFDYGSGSNNARVYKQQQGDSLICIRREGGLGNYSVYTYYGVKLP